MFVTSAEINSTNINYSAPLPPPSPRKAGLTPVSSNWTAIRDPPRSTMVTPRDPVHQAPGENTSSPLRTGSVQPRRRGSCSADMLESTMNEMNGGSVPQQPMNQGSVSMDCGGRHEHVQTAQTHPFAAASQHQMQSVTPKFRQQPFGQIPAAQQQPQQQHSTISAMDLMALSTVTKPQTSNNQHSTFGMFKSSSHHTSHTAAAGDLLSMTLDNPFARAKEQNKRRAASYGGRPYENIMPQPSMGAFGPTQPAPQTAWPQQLNYTMLNQVSTGSASPSHSQQQLQNNEEANQNERNKKRCRRSDSFEMMDE